MADGRKHHALRWHHPSASAAIVSRGDEFAIRPNATGDGLEYSYDTSAWAPLAGGGSAIWSGIGDPTADQVIEMGAYRTKFNWTGVTPDTNFWLDDQTDDATGWLFRVTTSDAAGLKNPLLVEARAEAALVVDYLGNVVIGADNSTGFFTAPLQVQNKSVPATTAAASFTNYGNTGQFGAVAFITGRGDWTTQAALQAGDAIGLVRFYGYVPSTPTGGPLNVANIAVYASDTYTSSYRGADMHLMTAENTLLTRTHILIRADGLVGVGNNLVRTDVTAQLHVIGSVRLDLGSDDTGDMHYRAATTGLLTRISTSGKSAGNVLTLYDSGSGVLLPRWDTGGGGGSPGGTGTELQYRGGASTFSAVSNSSVSGGNVTFGAIDNTNANTLTFYRARSGPADISTGDRLGTIAFDGRVGGTQQNWANIYATYEGGIGAITLNAPTLNITGTITFADGLRQIFNPNGSNAGLNVGSNAGTLSTPQNGDIYYDSTSNLFQFRQNAAWAGLSNPAGSASELQFRSSATAFGAVTNSSVNGADVTVAGMLKSQFSTTANKAGLMSIVTYTNSSTLSGAFASQFSTIDSATAAGDSYKWGTYFLYTWNGTGSYTDHLATARFNATVSENLGTFRTLYISVPSVASGKTLTTSEAIRIGAQGGSGTITNSVVLVSEAGTGHILHGGGHFALGTTTAADAVWPVTVLSSANALATASATLTVYGSTDKERLECRSIGFSPGFMGKRGNGTFGGAITPAASGNILAFLGGSGHCGDTGANHDAGGWFTSQAAGVFIIAGETWDDSPHQHGAYVSIQTTDNGSTTRTERLRVAGSGDIILNPQSALTTSSTAGFTWLPSCAGTPSAPAASFSGSTPTVVDTSGSRILGYIGGTWVNLGGGSSGYATVQDEGTSVTPARTILNFVGGPVSVADDGANSRTNITISAVVSSASTGQIPYTTGTNTQAGISGTTVSGSDITWAGGLHSWTYTSTATSGTVSYHTQTTTLSPASNSTAAHRLLDQSFAFGTAFNSSALRLRYASNTHNQTGTINSFYADEVNYTNSAGTTTTAGGYNFTYNSSAGTTAQAVGYQSSLNVSAGTLTSATGFYATFEQSGGTLTTVTGFRMFVSGTIGTTYGIILPASYSGFGIASPTATLHVSGTVALDLGSDATGDIFYRNSSGFLTRLAAGTNGHVLTLASGLPSWAAAGGGSPAGSGSELQYRNAGAFGAVTDSSVSGAALTLGGDLTLQKSGTIIHNISVADATGAAVFRWHRARGTLGSKSAVQASDSLGGMEWYGQYNSSGDVVGAAIIALAYANHTDSIHGADLHFRTRTESDAAPRTRLRVNADGKIIVGTNVSTTTANAQFHVVGSVQFDLGSDATGDIFYRSSGGNLTRLVAGTNGHVLTLASGLPSWAAPSGGSGYATIQDEGSGVTARTILNFVGGAVSVADDSGNSRTNVTISAVVSSATGSQIPYTTGTNTQAGISGTSVSGADVTWGGYQTQTFNNANTSGTYSYYDQNITITAASNSTAVHRLRDIGVTFSTAVNTSSLRLTYSDINHNQTGTVSSFYGSDITYANTAGTTATVNGHNFTYNGQAGTTSQAIAYQSALNAGGGTLSSAIGYYATFDRSSGTLTSATGFRMFASGTIGTMYGLVVPLGTLNGLGVATPGYALDVANTTASTTGLNVLANYDFQSSGTPADGFGLSALYRLQSSTTASQLAAQFDVSWQESTHADRSAIASIRTVHKGQSTTIQRQLWGGYKTLTDNTRTDIFSVTFGTSDHKAVAGVVHLTVFAKQTSGSNQIQVYRKSVPFLAAHNAATLTGFGIWGGEFGALGGVSTGSISFTFECNTTGYPSYALNANTYTYQLTANSDLTTIAEFFVHYNIEYNGEVEVALAA